MSATTNQYKFSFILDLRNTEDDVAKVFEDINEAISAVGGETIDGEEIGMRDLPGLEQPLYARPLRYDYCIGCGYGRS